MIDFSDLYLKYVEIRSAYEENQERQEIVSILKDRARLLENEIETLNGDRRAFEDEISEMKSQLNGAHREIHKLNNLYEKQQEKCTELQQMQENTGNTDAAVAKLR